MILSKIRFISLVLSFFGLCLSVHAQTYTSPFAITLDPNIGTWTSDVAGRIALVNNAGTPTPAQWYNYNDPAWNTYGHSFGPGIAQLYAVDNPANFLDPNQFYVGNPTNAGAINPVPGGVDPNDYYRQRVLSVASQFIGTPYQHHHNPFWDPYSNGFVSSPTNAPNYWPWSPVSNETNLNTTAGVTLSNIWLDTYGFGTEGIDCSDFASYVYNTALGIHMTGNVSALGEEVVGTMTSNPIIDAYGNVITPQFINSPNYNTGAVNAPGSLDSVFSQLLPGDLLFISAMPNNTNDISHVVMWLGSFGTMTNGSASSVPLVISSHDNTPAIFDTGTTFTGTNLPPPGVHILPMTSDNWFYQNFSHAMRVIAPTPIPEPGTIMLLLIPGVFFAGVLIRKKFRVTGRLTRSGE